MSNSGVRHDGLRALQAGTAPYRVLSHLEFADGDTAELRATCGASESEASFLRRVMFKLWDAHLVDRLDKNRWRITTEGRTTLAQLGGARCPTSAGEARPSRGLGSSTTPAQFELPPGVERWMLTSSQGRARSMTEAEKAPAPVRSEGLDFARHPSRRGDRLYWRNGRVTDLDGNPIEAAA